MIPRSEKNPKNSFFRNNEGMLLQTKQFYLTWWFTLLELRFVLLTALNINVMRET